MSAPGLPCIHCGLCLEACPTYRVLGTEADSPRGRIYLMEAIDKGETELDDQAALHLSRCLGCLACETACPSGVSFGRRIEEFRPRIAERGSFWSDAAREVYTNNRLVDIGLRVAGVLDRVGLGDARRKVPGLGLLPAAEAGGSAEVTPLRRSRSHQPLRARARVAVLTGCVGDRLLPGINRDTVEVLQRNGIEVVDAPGQGCCGALAQHSGRKDEAAAQARANVEAFRNADVDFVVSTAAGCGAMLRDYGHVLAGGDDQNQDVAEDVTGERLGAQEVADLSRDICELLVEVGFERPKHPLHVEGNVAYHDACHLLHARGISSAPRAILEAAYGKAPVDLGENAICCGSAGSYNLDHPVISAELGARKAELAKSSSAAVVAVANVGCLLQISRALAMSGNAAPVRHPISLLAEAYRLSDAAQARGSDKPPGDSKRRAAKKNSRTSERRDEDDFSIDAD